MQIYLIEAVLKIGVATSATKRFRGLQTLHASPLVLVSYKTGYKRDEAALHEKAAALSGQ